MHHYRSFRFCLFYFAEIVVSNPQIPLGVSLGRQLSKFSPINEYLIRSSVTNENTDAGCFMPQFTCLYRNKTNTHCSGL